MEGGHDNSDENCIRYVYMIEVDNKKRKILYTGQTKNISRRIMEHLSHRNSKYLAKYFKAASKKLVYIEYIKGTEYDAIGREYEIKPMSVKAKRKLIESDKNKLVLYKPGKALILKHIYDDSKQYAIKLYSGSLF